ncbi:uncharacterized protein LOC115093300 [Rhinatrema bivittatum]|uniref:uncharacterized protein LOC115093300 n=1 Tax=Rhinatrema bivittatum TaxID=194408 RepID=UPI00112BD5A3|nr:uncharacterized protein LOC115093300 [Rhinatrema bivittatum]
MDFRAREAWKEQPGYETSSHSGLQAWLARRGEPEEATRAAPGYRTDPKGSRNFTGCAWILGHSYIHRAQRRALKRPYGENLELNKKGWNLAWFSKRGMTWEELLPFLYERIDMWGAPDMLLIHLGGNDVGYKTCRELLTCMKKDISQLWIRWPKMRIGWSDIIIRLRNREELIWRIGIKKLNRQMGKWMGWQGGFWVRHQWSWMEEAGLFAGDGVHLSEIGMDMFNNAIQEGLEKEVAAW